jgi:hypothetical protein
MMFCGTWPYMWAKRRRTGYLQQVNIYRISLVKNRPGIAKEYRLLGNDIHDLPMDFKCPNLVSLMLAENKI